jgi:hypothetical protein
MKKGTVSFPSIVICQCKVKGIVLYCPNPVAFLQCLVLKNKSIEIQQQQAKAAFGENYF